ncbi:MAG: hypothetical protein ACFNS5_09635, partial [Prevotella melaninogenica]
GNGDLIRKDVGTKLGNFTVTDVKERSLDDMKKAATYAGWAGRRAAQTICKDSRTEFIAHD